MRLRGEVKGGGVCGFGHGWRLTNQAGPYGCWEAPVTSAFIREVSSARIANMGWRLRKGRGRGVMGNT